MSEKNKVSATKRAETMDEAYEKLTADLPEEAIERSDGNKTGKGYDTTGYGYQFIVNRFNEVLGLSGWGFDYKILESYQGESASQRIRYSVVVSTKIWIKVGEEQAERECAGGHVSNNYADALKGAITNSFKKTAALLGVGKKAYEGTVDDDNKPEDADPKAEMTKVTPYQSNGKKLTGPVTDKQLGMVNALITKKGVDREKIKEYYKVESLKDLSKDDASKLIDQLTKKPDAPIEGEGVIE